MTSIPLADLPSLARAATRTRRLRLVLAALAATLATVALAVALRQHPPVDVLLPRGSSATVVLDVSASISPDTYARIAATLDRLGRSGSRAGLVLFSDTAYQALPPGTPAAELRRFARFFTVVRPSQPGFQPRPPRNPWTDAFSAGTRISTGLQLALDVVRGQRLRRPLVLLVSDLDDDAGDLESVTRVVLAYRRLGIPIRVVGLNASPEDAQLVERLLPHRGDLVQGSLPGERTAVSKTAVPRALLATTLALALVLAAFLVVTERVRWTRP